jgi:hypothetical protein
VEPAYAAAEASSTATAVKPASTAPVKSSSPSASVAATSTLGKNGRGYASKRDTSNQNPKDF